MSYFQITEDDYNNLKKKLEEVLGEGYEVETHKEVSALMGAIRETFDLVGFSLSIYPSFRLQNYHYFSKNPTF